MQNFTKSYSQKYIARILSVYGYEFKENQYFSDFYEVDLVLPSHNIAIEVIGKPYHVSQFTQDLYPKLHMKIRHLKRLGLKVILVSDKETATLQLQKSINLLMTINHPICLSLINNEMKII
jgi:hypothetical protein